MFKLKETNAKMLRCVETFEKEEGFAELCSNPQKIQSERVEEVDLPEEKGGGWCMEA